MRTLAKDLQRATGRWTPIYANTVQFSVSLAWLSVAELS